MVTIIGSVVVLAMVLGVLGAVVQQVISAPPPSGDRPDAPVAEVVDLPAPAPGEALTGPTPCPAADGSSPRVTAFAEPPPTCTQAGSAYEAVVTTSAGVLRFQLDAATAPGAVNNLAVLAGYHFYDGQPITGAFARTAAVASIVFDPPAPTPPPGYGLPREGPEDRAYVPGSLAFVPDTDAGAYGAALAVLTFEGVADLPPGLTSFGVLDTGPDSAATLAALERAASADGTPTEVVTITSVAVQLAS
jgi:hypothetical protein